MRPFVTAIANVALLLAAGCSTTASYGYDSTAVQKMAAYESFAIARPTDTKGEHTVLLSPIVDRRIERSLTQKLEAKGFREDAERPDFIVSFKTMTKTSSETHDYSTGFRRSTLLSGYRHGYIEADEFEEGVYIIDIIDQLTDELVWRGVDRQRLGKTAPNEAQIGEIVSRILVGFPMGR